MRLRALLLAVLCVTAVAACGADDERLHVFAAASLVDVVERLAAGHQAAGSVSVSVGATSSLARQIADGAPADVFVSANRDWVAWLGERALLNGEPVAVARNTLVCVAPVAGEPGVDEPAWRDLTALAAAGVSVAVADAAVPAGDYARQAFDGAGVLEVLAPRLVGQRDARAVLAAVASGNLPAGIVYASDAAARPDAVRVVFAVDPALHETVTCWAAALRDAAQPAAARAFLERLRGEAGRAVFAELGFGAP